MAGCRPAHPPPETASARRGAIAAPERHPIPNCKQTSLLTKTSWDSGLSTSAERVTARISLPEERRHARCTLRKSSGWDGEGDKSQPSTWGNYTCQGPGHMSCSDLGRAQNAGPTKSAPLWSTLEPEPERLRPGKCMQTRAHIIQFPAEQPRV